MNLEDYNSLGQEDDSSVIDITPKANTVTPVLPIEPTGDTKIEEPVITEKVNEPNPNDGSSKSTEENGGLVENQETEPLQTYNEHIEKMWGFQVEGEITTNEQYVEAVEKYYTQKALNNIPDSEIAVLIKEGISLEEYTSISSKIQDVDKISSDELLEQKIVNQIMYGVDPPPLDATQEAKDDYNNQLSEAQSIAKARLGNKSSSWKEEQASSIREEMKKNQGGNIYEKIRNFRQSKIDIYLNQEHPRALSEMKTSDEKYLENLTSFSGYDLSEQDKKDFIDYRQNIWKVNKEADGSLNIEFQKILDDKEKARELQMLYFLHEKGVFKDLLHTGKQKGKEDLISQMPSNISVPSSKKSKKTKIDWDNVS